MHIYFFSKKFQKFKHLYWFFKNVSKAWFRVFITNLTKYDFNKMKTRLIDKLEIKDENVVKPIYFEGLKKKV